MKKLMLILTLFFLLDLSAYAAVEIKQFKTPQQEQRYKNLINEFRCVVCQNQNIADSNAELAQDLRKQVYKMINAGKSDDEILDFMVTRYGDFVLYRPLFNANTFILWVGPFIIFVLGFYVLIRFIRQRKRIVTTELSANEKEKLKQLLQENKEETK